MLLVPFDTVLSDTWSVSRELDWFPDQMDLVRRIAKHPAGLNTRAVQGKMNLFICPV